MIFTPEQLAYAATSYERRFRLAYLSSGFEPTIVFACKSHLLMSNLYRGLLLKRHFLGAADTGKDALELVARQLPNIFAFDDSLSDQSASSLIAQAMQMKPGIRILAFVTKLDSFFGYPDCPIAVAEADVLTHPNTLAFAAMAMISNTSYLSPSIHQRLQQLDRTAPDIYPGTISLTRRERQLLDAYSIGLSNKEIANQLGLSVRSVQTYSGNLLQKLGTNNRQKALRKAIALGLAELGGLLVGRQP
jgi:two-component system secretion response regulator SsrB